MTPTPELRWVERELPYPEVRTVKVLQQKWQHKDYPVVIETEWRDVPVVKEVA